MKIDRKKFELTKARKRIGNKEIIASGISNGTIQRVIAGEEIMPKTAGRIAYALGVDVTEIIENVDERESALGNSVANRQEGGVFQK